MYQAAWQQTSYRFSDLKELLAKATPARSGDFSPVSPRRSEENIAAQMALADVPLRQFLNEAVIPYEDDEVTRLIIDTHDAAAFADRAPDRRRFSRLAPLRGRHERRLSRSRRA